MGPKRTKSQLMLKTNRLSHKIQQPPTRVGNIIDKDNFKFISEEYSKYLKCPLCKQLMIRPMRFHPCAHTFCQACIQYMMHLTKKYCPLENCLAKCAQVQNDRTAESLIDQLKVACTNQGCKWKGQYENYKKTHRDTCPLKGMGLDKYLQELRRMPIVSKTNLYFQLQHSEKRHSDRSMTQSQHFLRTNSYEKQEIQQNHEKIEQKKSQESQQNNHTQSRLQDKVQILLEKDQNKREQEKQYILPQQIQAVRSENFINRENEPKLNDLTNIDKTSKKEQQKCVGAKPNAPQLPKQIQLEISRERRIQNNNFIINLPFGPSFQLLFNQNSRGNSKYVQKELKKLQ